MTNKRPPSEIVVEPPDYDKADVAALQAMWLGSANESQQKRALDWIIRWAAATYDVSYRPERPHDTAFAEGRRFVGLQVLKLVNLGSVSLKPQGENEHV